MNMKNYISVHDIAENARLNFELDKWFEMPYRKGCALRGMTVLFFLACFPSFVQAETCTATPDCKTLGYTESSCPDGGGVKCPWNTSLMYCGKKCAPSCEVKTCAIGDVLYSDKKCYTCPNAYTLPGVPPIGVVFTSGKAVALTDLGDTDYGDAKSKSSSYSVGGITGWYLPNKDELLAIFSNINAIQTGLQSAIGGSQLSFKWYWSSSVDPNYANTYYVVNPISGATANYGYYTNIYYVRPVLAF